MKYTINLVADTLNFRFIDLSPYAVFQCSKGKFDIYDITSNFVEMNNPASVSLLSGVGKPQIRF